MKKFYTPFKVKLTVLIFLSILSNSVVGQRSLVYPVILVHGLGGDNGTWEEFTNILQINAGLSIERTPLTFDLDFDKNTRTSYLYGEVSSYNNSVGNHDVYTVNFDIGPNGNQSALVKQGYALKFAIEIVLAATGAENVILLGHSMGGLAIREYYQNSSNWQNDGNHHVAKIATIGTPHGGSNLGGGDFNLGLLNEYLKKGNSPIDERSEAVRDLRRSYKSGYNGVYLFGGYETNTVITRGLGSQFFNIDVNCNGLTGNYVTGLNDKTFYFIDFACIIGGIDNDIVVKTYSQNINNFYVLNAEIIQYNCDLSGVCHLQEPKKAINEMIHALDEPRRFKPKVKFDNVFSGFFSYNPSYRTTDQDEYSFYVPSNGVLSLAAKTENSFDSRVIVKNSDGNIILNESIDNNTKSKTIRLTSSGNYNLVFTGNPNNNWSKYIFGLTFCSLPSNPIIFTNENTTFCEGNSSTLTTDSKFSGYKWFKDGQEIDNNSPELIAKETGNYAVQGLQCGVSLNSLNSLSIKVNPIPNKPNISKEELPDKFVLTSSNSENLEWYFNGNLLNNEKSQTFNPQELGNYKVKVIKDGCSNISDDLLIKMEKPTLILDSKSAGCEGDSLKIKTQSNFSKYVYSYGKNEINSIKNEVYLKKTGNYSVVTHRGKFSSPPSDSIKINIYPYPQKPILTIENFSLKSSSNSNNQWFVNGVDLKDSTNQILRIFGPENYQVKVTENGCSSISDKFLVLSEEKNLLFDSNLKIYPNPNNGNFEFEFYSNDFKPIEINIYNSFGKNIYNKTIKINGKYFDKISIQNNPAGQYYLSLQKDKSTKVAKFEIH